MTAALRSNAQVLPIPRPDTGCAVAGMALQARKAIDAYTFTDRNNVTSKTQIMDAFLYK